MDKESPWWASAHTFSRPTNRTVDMPLLCSVIHQRLRSALTPLFSVHPSYWNQNSPQHTRHFSKNNSPEKHPPAGIQHNKKITTNLFFGDGVAASLASSPERGESGAVSGEPWGSSSCSLMKGLMWSLRSMMKKCCDGVTLGRSPLIPGGWWRWSFHLEAERVAEKGRWRVAGQERGEWWDCVGVGFNF